MHKLSFSLPKYAHATARLIREVHRGLYATDELLSQIRPVQVAHGGTTRQVSVPQVLETEMAKHVVEVVLKLESFRQTNVEEFGEFIWTLYTSLSSQIKERLFETISQVTEVTGHQVDAQGRKFWDVYVEMIQSSVMVFDEAGNHHHQLVVHPDIYKKIMDNPPSPEQEQKIENAINAKREEYYAQKRTRRLS